MGDNPWDVDSLEVFTFLKCPECTFDTKEESNFLEHAYKDHPMSSVFFDRRLKKEAETEEVISSVEPNDYLDSEMKEEAWPYSQGGE